MAKTALTQLQDQIDAIRREAYAEGYAAAMQAIRDFVARPAPAAAPARGAEVAARAPARPAPVRGRAKKAGDAAPRRSPRPQRGTNARLIEGVLQAIAPRAARPTEIRKAIQRDHALAIPFTSIRHALGQLEARRIVEQVANSKTWRYVAAAGGAAEDN